MRKRVYTFVLYVAMAGAAIAAPPEFRQAKQLYDRTEYEAALKLLSSATPKDAAVYILMGQCHYMKGDPAKAVDLFQKAAALTPQDSDTWMWLGRAYGRRAEMATIFTAPSYASKARTAMETAVQRNPQNLDAISDLFEYYLEAPGFLGGGFDKAQALAERIREIDPSEYYWAQARLAEKRKQYQTAEQQLERAAELAPRRLIDLAKLLARSGQYQKSEEAFRKAETLNPNFPRLLFERASTYIQTGRNLRMAQELLKRYLQAPLTPDDPPRSEAERLLKQASKS